MTDVTIGELSRRLDERDDRLERRLESIDLRLATINGNIARHEREMAVLGTKTRALEHEVFRTSKKVWALMLVLFALLQLIGPVLAKAMGLL